MSNMKFLKYVKFKCSKCNKIIASGYFSEEEMQNTLYCIQCDSPLEVVTDSITEEEIKDFKNDLDKLSTDDILNKIKNDKYKRN